MYKYTVQDRMQQLDDLRIALQSLIPVVLKYSLPYTDEYEAALVNIERLLSAGFNHSDLIAISDSIPDIVDRHRDWEAKMLEQQDDGSWAFPQWLIDVDTLIQPVMNLKSTLRQIGFY
nr:hypothetical protein [uncultured Tolumonas sp.]